MPRGKASSPQLQQQFGRSHHNLLLSERGTQKLFDELSNDERLHDPELAFKTQVFLSIIDTALFYLQSRFEGQHLVSSSFSLLYPKPLLQLSDADLNSAAQKFQLTVIQIL